MINKSVLFTYQYNVVNLFLIFVYESFNAYIGTYLQTEPKQGYGETKLAQAKSTTEKGRKI